MRHVEPLRYPIGARGAVPTTRFTLPMLCDGIRRGLVTLRINLQKLASRRAGRSIVP